MIPFFDYRREYAKHRNELHRAISRVLESGKLILDREVIGFEDEFAEYVGAKYAVGVNSGTDALAIAMRALGIGTGDEVITVPNTVVATVAAIRTVGATPRFVDVEPGGMLMDAERIAGAVTDRTRAIVPVHLYGRPVDMDRILAKAEELGIPVVEDCAQAHGARWRGRHVGTFGTIGCFSFYPTKNLGAFGDGGACVTDREELGDRLRALRQYGCRRNGVAEWEGINSRLDELQAAILRAKLVWLPELLDDRRRIAAQYESMFEGTELGLPPHREDGEPSHHLFVVRTDVRRQLTAALDHAKIGWGIHYRVPIHLMPAYDWLNLKRGHFPVAERASDEVLSLPLYPGLDRHEVEQIGETVLSIVGA